MAWSEAARRAAIEARRRRAHGRLKPPPGRGGSGGSTPPVTRASLAADYKRRMANLKVTAADRKAGDEWRAHLNNLRAQGVTNKAKLVKQGYTRVPSADVRGPEGFTAWRKGGKKVRLVGGQIKKGW